MLHSVSDKNECSHLFAAFFEYAAMGILLTDIQGQITAINPYALKEFGYSKDELTGKNIKQLIPQEFYKKYTDHLAKYANHFHDQPKGLDVELSALRKDGTEFPATISFGHYSSNGNNYIIVFVLKVFERKKMPPEIYGIEDLKAAKEQLEESNARLENVLSFQKTLLDTAGVMIIATDERGIIRLFNPEAEAKLGYHQQEILNKETPAIFHTKSDIERKRKELLKTFGIKISNPFDILVEKARRNIHEEEQYSYIDKNGVIFPVSLIITTIKTTRGKITGFMGVAMDISERIKAEKELKKVQQLFLQLLHNFPDGAISIIDKNFHFVYTGGNLHRRLHANIKELIGKEIYPLFPMHLRKILFEMLENVFSERIYISDFELPYPIKNRTYIMDAFPLIEEDGSVNNVGVIIKNISKLKKAEEGLREALKIERNLGELKSRFVSMASHEFRTPLSTVLSSAYLIEKYTSAEDQSKREKHLRRIISSVNMLTDTLNEFLNIGKIEEGKLQVKFTEFNLKEMIQATIDEIKNNLKKDQQINYRHEGNPNVLLDNSLIKHILMNLISNASKFSYDASPIQIKTINQNGHIVLSVKDEGIGISKEDQKHLMERFFRGANAANIQGTGLGLHIISKYVEMMDGIIQCKSQLEKGSEFTLTFSTKKNSL